MFTFVLLFVPVVAGALTSKEYSVVHPKVFVSNSVNSQLEKLITLHHICIVKVLPKGPISHFFSFSYSLTTAFGKCHAVALEYYPVAFLHVSTILHVKFRKNIGEKVSGT